MFCFFVSGICILMVSYLFMSGCLMMLIFWFMFGFVGRFIVVCFKMVKVIEFFLFEFLISCC